MNALYLSVARFACFGIAGTENDPYIPEQWANEALMRLENTLVMAGMVHRDFENEVASFGQVVNSRRPEDFGIRRKTDADSVEFQTARSTNVQVPLDQWFSQGFVIKDGEGSLAFQDLAEKYLAPAADAIANGVDRALLGRIHEYLANRSGRLGALSPANASDFLLDARKIMNDNKVPVGGRKLVLGTASETAFLKDELFISADKRGASGLTALQEALLGRIHGYDTFMSQNVNGFSTGADTVTGTVTNALAAGAAIASQAVTVTGYEAKLGETATVAGNDQPTFVTAITASTNTTAVTLHEANRYATLALAALTVYKQCLVAATEDTEVGTSYPVGWSKQIQVDGHASGKGPQVGQILSTGVTAVTRVNYTIIETTVVSATSTKVTLDRPLVAALADNDPMFPGPSGEMNFAFHKNAIALVTRPLKLPQQRDGVSSAVLNFKGLSIRATMQYDIDVTGTKVHLDMLAGVAKLDEDLACVLLG